MRLIASGEIRPTSAPVRSVACRAVLRRSPSTSTSSLVESRPRRRGRTPKGPLPTGVMLAVFDSASPVESGLISSTACLVIVWTCSGIRRVSRSARAAVTLTSALNAPISSSTATSTWSAPLAITTVRAASAKPARVTITRYVPVAGTSNENRPSVPVSMTVSRPVATPRSTTRVPVSTAPVTSDTRPETVAAAAGAATRSAPAYRSATGHRHERHPPSVFSCRQGIRSL